MFSSVVLSVICSFLDSFLYEAALKIEQKGKMVIHDAN
jgi:hypothetical protein